FAALDTGCSGGPHDRIRDRRFGPHPDRKALRRTRGFQCRGARRAGDQGRARARGRRRGAGRLRAHGSRAARRPGSDHRAQVGGISREAQDELAAKSHDRAAAAQKEGRFTDEITPVSIPQRKGDPIVVDSDEGVRPGTSTESLGGLRPAFSKDGTITAGNASQISDGAAAVIVTSRAKAEELGVTPLAELIGYGMVAGPDTSLLTQPSRAIKRALEANDMTARDVDLFELNEAFAAVGIASMRDLGINDD